MSDDNTSIPCSAPTPSSLPSFSSNETAPPPPPEPFTGSSSRPQIPYFSPQAEPPSLHPFSALLTPYATYPDSPPPPGSDDNGDSSTWLPRSTLRCLLLSSSLPPPPPPQRLNEPQTPFKPHAAYHGVDSDEPNIARARAICYRVTKPTHAEACERETRKGVARWLRDLEGREVILVSGPEEVRDWALSGGEGMVDAVEAPLAAGDQEGIEAQAGVAWKLQQQQKLRRQDDEDAPLMLRGRNWPLVGEWLRGEENFTQLVPLHPPALALANASVKVLTTVESMFTRYFQSFTNGTQLGAVNIVLERSGLAIDYLARRIPEAFGNLPKNFEALREKSRSGREG